MATGQGSTDTSDYYAAIKLAAAAVAREEYEAALPVLKAVYQYPDKAPAEGLSLYGLCLALVEKKNKQGIELCERAIAAQAYDSSHRINLIKIYLHNKARKKAVDTMEQAVKALPKDRQLLAMRDRMGYRQRAPVPFLHRDNTVNQYLGRRRNRPQVSRAPVSGVVKIVGGALFFIALFVGTLLFMLRTLR